MGGGVSMEYIKELNYWSFGLSENLYVVNFRICLKFKVYLKICEMVCFVVKDDKRKMLLKED